jgi:acylphosphatase
MNPAHSRLASLHATVYGRVQGVYFRAFVEEHAHALGLTGSVRNVLQPAAVEVHAEGERSALERLLEQLHEGPPDARVDRVEVEWGEYQGRFGDFRVTG